MLWNASFVTQMAELRRAFHSQGNFEVLSTFGKFVVSDSVWQSMSAEDSDAHVASFLAYRPRQATTSTTVMSTNGVLSLQRQTGLVTVYMQLCFHCILCVFVPVTLTD